MKSFIFIQMRSVFQRFTTFSYFNSYKYFKVGPKLSNHTCTREVVIHLIRSLLKNVSLQIEIYIPTSGH